MDAIEHAFACPYCAAPISVVLDHSVPEQTYIEDCEVCCNPLELTYAFDGDLLIAFEARSIEQ